MLNYRTIDSQCLMGTVGHNCTPLKMCLEPSPLSTTLHGLRQSKETLGKCFIFLFFHNLWISKCVSSLDYKGFS